ncbi:hypothetical protein ScPMuIL_012865, partial [Solemya velum]
VLPLADSVFIADASSMDQLESEAAIPSQDLHTVDWQKEQASDGILSRVIELFKSGVRPTGNRYKKNYDLKVRDSVLEVGDRVLVRNVGLKGKNKLADKWAKDPYIIIDIPNKDFPVYKVQKESAGGPTRTLHRNMLLPFTLIPANDIVSDHQKQPDIGKRLLRPQAVINSTSSEDSESSSDESTLSRRYIIPQRRTRNIRDQPQPARPTAPTNQSS